MLTRRQLIGVGLVAGIGGLVAGISWVVRGTPNPLKPKGPLAYLAPTVKPEAVWTPDDFNAFLAMLQTPERLTLRKAIGAQKLSETSLTEPDARATQQELRDELLWRSSSAITYPFKNGVTVPYHDIVVWCAGALGVTVPVGASTFAVERMIVEKQFADIWDRLSVAQRQQLLQTIDPDGRIGNVGAVASMGGAAALAALSSTIYFAGFAFYTTMSVVICTVAGWFGVTLPFVAYTSASVAASLLAGPIGWSIIAVGLAVGAAFTLASSPSKTAELIAQIHFMKAQALEDAR